MTISGSDVKLPTQLEGVDLRGLAQGGVDDEAATRNRLLIAAVKLFAERGYEACSMRELAAEVGVKAPAIYNHFASKTDVLVFAVDYALSDFLVAVLQDIDQVPDDQRLFEVLRRHARYKTADVSLARAQDRLVDADFWRRSLPTADYARFTYALRSYRAVVQECLIAAAPAVSSDGDVATTVLVSALLEMCDQVSSWYRPDGELSGAQVADQIVIIARRMVSAQPVPVA